MTDETIASEPKWYQKPGVIGAMLTVGALALGGLGYTMSIADQGELAAGLGMVIAGAIQIVNVVKNVIASKK